MTRSRALGLVGIPPVMFVVGVLAVQAAPDGGRAMGIWPVGLATGWLILARGRRTPVALLVTFVIAVSTIRLGGRPLDVAIGYAVGVALETWVVWRLMTRGESAQPSLLTTRDLNRFLGAAMAGALTIAAASFVTSVVTGWGSPPLVALAVGAAHLASQLTVTPFFTRLHRYGAMAPPGERVLQWLLVVTVTPLVFLPVDFPSLAFLVIPLLGWAALRISSLEAMAQLVTVVAVVISMTSWGNGPFAGVAKTFDLPVDSRGMMLAAFAIACALIVIPLVLRSGEQMDHARQAAAEHSTVQNIVNNAMGVAIIGSDETGRITLFNPGAQRLLGYEREEVLGRFTTMFHSPRAVADKARELGVLNDFNEVVQAMVAPQRAGTDMDFVRKDGVERTHSMTLARMVDDRGRVTGYVSTSEDITERVRAEEALRKALEQERRAVEQLREVDVVKDAFVSSVSHELRTPITSILGYLEMLQEGAYGALNDDQLDAVQRVSGNSNRLVALIDDLLTLSRVQDDGFGIVDRAFDLRDAMKSGYDVVAPAWSTRELGVALELPAEPVPFVGDKELVERVLINLLTNAVKFTPDGGSVSVHLSVQDTMAVLRVSDSGIGIPVEEQVHLFTRFFRSTLAQKHAIPGSGLGLSIARGIVEKHGGSMTVESAAGAGTTFLVRLPIVT